MNIDLSASSLKNLKLICEIVIHFDDNDPEAFERPCCLLCGADIPDISEPYENLKHTDTCPIVLAKKMYKKLNRFG